MGSRWNKRVECWGKKLLPEITPAHGRINRDNDGRGCNHTAGNDRAYLHNAAHNAPGLCGGELLLPCVQRAKERTVGGILHHCAVAAREWCCPMCVWDAQATHSTSTPPTAQATPRTRNRHKNISELNHSKRTNAGQPGMERCAQQQHNVGMTKLQAINRRGREFPRVCLERRVDIANTPRHFSAFDPPLSTYRD